MKAPYGGSRDAHRPLAGGGSRDRRRQRRRIVDSLQRLAPECLCPPPVIVLQPLDERAEGAGLGQFESLAATQRLVQSEQLTEDDQRRVAVYKGMAVAPDEPLFSLGAAAQIQPRERRTSDLKASLAVGAQKVLQLLLADGCGEPAPVPRLDRRLHFLVDHLERALGSVTAEAR